MDHCQICGREQGLRTDGTVKLHHVNGTICDGTHFPPIEADNAWLNEQARRAQAEHQAARRRYAQLIDSRANYIPPGLPERIERLGAKARRLSRRARRIANWPARYEAQMRNRGYADVPPAYLPARWQERWMAA